MTLAVALVVLAFGLVMAEVAFPSFGVLSLLAALCYAVALWKAFETGAAAGWSLVAVGVVLLPVALGLGIKVLPRTPLGRRLILGGPGAEVQHGTRTEDMHALKGCEGLALTDLRPSGTAEIAGQRVDVVASSGYVARGTRIAVQRVEGTRIVVEPAATEKEHTP